MPAGGPSARMAAAYLADEGAARRRASKPLRLVAATDRAWAETRGGAVDVLNRTSKCAAIRFGLPLWTYVPPGTVPLGWQSRHPADRAIRTGVGRPDVGRKEPPYRLRPLAVAAFSGPARG